MFRDSKMNAISSEIKNEFIQWWHQYMNSYDGTDSWFDSSILSLSEYCNCEGDSAIAWKKPGYRTLFSVLMVFNIPVIFDSLYISQDLYNIELQKKKKNMF